MNTQAHTQKTDRIIRTTEVRGGSQTQCTNTVAQVRSFTQDLSQDRN